MSSLPPGRERRVGTRALLGASWYVARGAAGELVWAELRDGLVSVAGLSRTTRALVGMGFALLALMVVILLTNGWWRESWPLLAMPLSNSARGALPPLPLIPITLLVVTIAWGYLLTGAIHAHPLLRVPLLLLYLITSVSWGLLGAAGGAVGGPNWLAIGISALSIALVPFVFLVRWRAAPRPGREFPLLFALVAGTIVPAHAQLMTQWRVAGDPLILTQLESMLTSLIVFTLPLLLFFGLDLADFAWRSASYVSASAAERLPAAGLRGLLVVLLLWRLWAVVNTFRERVATETLGAELVAYTSALIGFLLLIGVWALITERGTSRPPLNQVRDDAERRAFPLILLFFSFDVLTFLLVFLALVPLLIITLLSTEWGGRVGGLYDAFIGLTAGPTLRIVWTSVASLGAIVAGTLLRRRALPFALYLGFLGALALWATLTDPAGPLALLEWRPPEPLEFWSTLLVAGVAVRWWRTGTLTTPRAARLLLVLVLLALLDQADFLENPFSPLLGSLGIGFVAFAVVWDALTIGAWANGDSRGFPRESRLFLYLGYILLTVTLLDWATLSHDLTTEDVVSGAIVLRGLDLFGRPLLFALATVLLMIPPTRPGEDPTGSDALEPG